MERAWKVMSLFIVHKVLGTTAILEKLNPPTTISQSLRQYIGKMLAYHWSLGFNNHQTLPQAIQDPAFS